MLEAEERARFAVLPLRTRVLHRLWSAAVFVILFLLVVSVLWA